MARPTKLTPDVQEAIVDGINAGLTFRLSCARAGVNPATFYRWLGTGETANVGRYREFCDAVERAKADSALRLVSQITLQAPADWRAAAFMLERRFPDDYGRRTEVTGKDGGPVKVDTKNSACLPAKRRKCGRRYCRNGPSLRRCEMVTQTKIPPLTVSNPWWGHDPSDKQLEALWAYEECPDLFYGRRRWPRQDELPAHGRCPVRPISGSGSVSN